MIKAVFFDMNETMLNIEILGENFSKYFNDKYVGKYWFTKLLHSSVIMGGVMGEVSIEKYVNFGELAQTALESVFHEHDMKLTAEIKKDILGAFYNMPAYDDVIPSLKYLKDKGVKVFALSNSSLKMIKEQLENAKIIHLFDAYHSVDAVNIYKPFKGIYHHVASQEKFSLNEIAMVASHDWDLFGAKTAGLTTAYIPRKKEIYNPHYTPADFTHNNMLDLVKSLI